MTIHKKKQNETNNQIVSECPKIAQREYEKGMIRSEAVFIGKFVERMESTLNQNGKSIKQKRLFRMPLAKYFGILLFRQTIL